MKAEELFLKKELTQQDANIVLKFLNDVINDKNKLKNLEMYNLVYIDKKGDIKFRYFDLIESIQIQNITFSKIAIMDGKGDVILSLLDDNFNSVTGVTIQNLYSDGKKYYNKKTRNNNNINNKATNNNKNYNHCNEKPIKFDYRNKNNKKEREELANKMGNEMLTNFFKYPLMLIAICFVLYFIFNLI